MLKPYTCGFAARHTQHNFINGKDYALSPNNVWILRFSWQKSYIRVPLTLHQAIGLWELVRNAGAIADLGYWYYLNFLSVVAVIIFICFNCIYSYSFFGRIEGALSNFYVEDRGILTVPGCLSVHICWAEVYGCDEKGQAVPQFGICWWQFKPLTTPSQHLQMLRGCGPLFFWPN